MYFFSILILFDYMWPTWVHRVEISFTNTQSAVSIDCVQNAHLKSNCISNLKKQSPNRAPKDYEFSFLSGPTTDL